MNIIFTNHAEQRTLKRKLSKQEIIDAIKYPDNIVKKHGKHYFQKKLQGGVIEIPCEKTERHIKVLTVYWL